MESTRGEGDATPESENNNPSKKRRMDSLLLEVENRNLDGLKKLISQGVDVKTTGNFSLNREQQFADVPALFAAIILDQQEIIEFLVNRYPHFSLHTNQELMTLPTNTNREQLIDSLELVGAICIFQGDVGAINHGFSCWKAAMKLRFLAGSVPLPKSTISSSAFESCVFNNKTEIENPAGLKALYWKFSVEWKKQAFFTSRRILTKYGCFPNRCVVENLYRYFFKEWRTSGLDSSRAFATILFIFEIFNERPTACPPLKDWNFILKIISDLEELLLDHSWLELQLNNEDTMVTFENMMFSLTFLCRYLETIQEFFPKNYPVRRRELLEVITDVIIVAGKIVIRLRKTKTQKAILNSCFSRHLQVYERRWSNAEPNLLLKLSTKRPMQYNQQSDFLMLRVLLKAGANPNVKDRQRNTTLHLLSRTECLDHTRWNNPSYVSHADIFTSTVKAILTENFYGDQVNIDGHRALQPFKDTSSRYPSAEFCNLLDNYFGSVRSLFCFSAIRVRELGLPCHDLPKTVQAVVTLL